MSNYSIALEKHMALYRGSLRLIESKIPYAEVEQLMIVTTEALRRAGTFYVSTPLCSLLEDAAASLPLETRLYREDLFSEGGFVLFEKPLTLPGRPDGESAGIGNLEALIWAVLEARDDRFYFSPPEQCNVAAVIACREIDGGMKAVPTPLAVVTWPFDMTLEHVQAHALNVGTGGARVPMELRYFMAFQLLTQQRVFAPQRERVDRATRRRLAAFDPTTDLVTVIQLRRHETRNADSSARAVDWSHQWIVGAHWRQQWYPKLLRHQAKWIAPYVKGPENKPLKMPGARVFAVVR